MRRWNLIMVLIVLFVLSGLLVFNSLSGRAVSDGRSDSGIIDLFQSFFSNGDNSDPNLESIPLSGESEVDGSLEDLSFSDLINFNRDASPQEPEPVIIHQQVPCGGKATSEATIPKSKAKGYSYYRSDGIFYPNAPANSGPPIPHVTEFTKDNAIERARKTCTENLIIKNNNVKPGPIGLFFEICQCKVAQDICIDQHYGGVISGNTPCVESEGIEDSDALNAKINFGDCEFIEEGLYYDPSSKTVVTATHVFCPCSIDETKVKLYNSCSECVPPRRVLKNPVEPAPLPGG